MKRKQGQKRHSYLIMFLVALKQRFWARREASPQCKKQCLRRCLDPIILVVLEDSCTTNKKILVVGCQSLLVDPVCVKKVSPT
jgi:hypothetical protein